MDVEVDAMIEEGQKIMKIIYSCITLDQLYPCEFIIDRYFLKWDRIFQHEVPSRPMYRAYFRREKILTAVYEKSDDGTEHF